MNWFFPRLWKSLQPNPDPLRGKVIHTVRGLFGEAITPVVRMATMVLKCTNTNLAGKHPVVDGIWKSLHEITPDI